MFRNWFGLNAAGRRKKAWEQWVEARINWADTKFRGMGKPTEYWPYNPAWVLKATFVPDSREIIVDTSKNRPRDEKLAGRLMFKDFTLEAQEIGQGLFVAFRDTSPLCYPGGKYLNLPKPEPNAEVTVDFNYAYNALCYYSSGYDCPIPSRANTLNFSIDAGQMYI